MALRLRKDIQKASYYVWFLGAEEARGLRGPRVLLPAIPQLIERSREQEPLKVTLQVSQKGMKIVQGASKHFITHSAITCSVQTDDIVACVLLLYNPTTKCPLHVHAYRCDSETTAQALHQFLQVLINRPENQKRFAELEARLGLQSMAVSSPTSRSQSSPDVLLPAKSTKLATIEAKTPVRRFESSLGSDTGTSTRESECSEELVAGSPALPKSSLYDSLAAELRAKLNGNGPPLLLPPRDYDTVHRSKGNLAATELRRCRNSLIVGDKLKKQQLQPLQKPTSTALTSRSRGSSGIGSDMAPSPERPIEHSSSDEEEWIPNGPHLSGEQDASPFHQARKTPQRQSSYPFKEHFDGNDINADQPPSYLYPSVRDEPEKTACSPYSASPDASHGAVDKRRLVRSNSREINGLTAAAVTGITALRSSATNNDEQDIRPIIIRPRTYESRFKHVLDERKYNDVDDGDLPATRQSPVAVKQATSKPTPPPQQEHNYRTAEDVQQSHKQGYNNNNGRYDVDDVDQKHLHDMHQAMSPIHNYRYGDKKPDARIKPDRDGFDYRENLTDREKYRESQTYYQMYKEQHQPQFEDQHHQQPHHHLDETSGLPMRKSYAESPSMMLTTAEKQAHSGARHDSSDGKPNVSGGGSVNRYGNEEHSALHHAAPTYAEPPVALNSGGYRQQSHNHHAPQHNHDAEGQVKLARSFKEKTAKAEYVAAAGNAPRNPYKEPDSMPYHESIEKMLKSPVMRYKSFESNVPPHPRDAAPIRYHNLDEADHAVQQPQRRRGAGLDGLHHQRAGSPDTVCRVSPKDRFNNAKEKFEAMERDRNYAAHKNRSMHQSQQQQPIPHNEEMHSYVQHQRSQSPPPPMRRSHHQSQHQHYQHQHGQQQRYSMHSGNDSHGKTDWSSEDEPCQQHHQQQRHHMQHHASIVHSRRPAPGSYRDGAGIPAPDPYNANDPSGLRGLGPPALGAAKSLGNLVRGYRHSYAEPRHQAPLPRNSGRVGLAAVNPF